MTRIKRMHVTMKIALRINARIKTVYLPNLKESVLPVEIDDLGKTFSF